MSESEKKNEKKPPYSIFKSSFGYFMFSRGWKKGGEGEEEESAPQQLRQRQSSLASNGWTGVGVRVRAVVGLGCYESWS